MRRGMISAGDLVKAVAALEADDDVAAKIAGLLGIAVGAPANATTIEQPIDGDAETESDHATAAHSIEQLSDADVARHIPSRIERLPERGSKKLRLSFETSATLPPPSSEEHEPAPPFEPLLRPVTSRAIVSHALSTRQVTGIDVERAVERIAARERIDPLPLRLVATMRRGVQLLVDAGTGMTPFRRDQAALTDWIEKVVGRDRVVTASFLGTPRLRSFGAGPRGRYEPPAPLTPVVLLTDLGIGRPRRLDNAASLEEWLAFGEQLRRARCPAIAFVPYPRERWPVRLRRAFTILEWDRALTASRVRRVR